MIGKIANPATANLTAAELRQLETKNLARQEIAKALQQKKEQLLIEYQLEMDYLRQSLSAQAA